MKFDEVKDGYDFTSSVGGIIKAVSQTALLLSPEDLSERILDKLPLYPGMNAWVKTPEGHGWLEKKLPLWRSRVLKARVKRGLTI